MVQPETWKAIGEYTGKVWTAVGPLVGVLVGALLAHSWERKRWEKENRKEECRELIKSISHAATLILNVAVGAGASQHDAHNAYQDTVQVFHGRIFIAEDIEKTKIVDMWAHAVGEFGAQKIDANEFGNRVEEVRRTIINFVVPKKTRKQS